MNFESAAPDILTVRNNLFIHGEITQEMSAKVITRIKEMHSQLHKVEPLIITISSDGGDVYAGFAIAQEMMRLSEERLVMCMGVGVVASAATLIFLGATERRLDKYSWFMVHNHQGWLEGHMDRLEGQMNGHKILRDQLVEFYESRTKCSRKKIKKMLSSDTWLTPQQCLEYGFTHVIM